MSDRRSSAGEAGATESSGGVLGRGAKPPSDAYRAAALAYLGYGVAYWLGGTWLAVRGVDGRSGGPLTGQGILWILLGLVFVVLIPFLLWRRRRAFERWVLSRRDFARLLSVLVALRAVGVARVALRSASAVVAAPWGGTISVRAGAALFLLVTVTALFFVARAAWGEETTA